MPSKLPFMPPTGEGLMTFVIGGDTGVLLALDIKVIWIVSIVIALLLVARTFGPWKGNWKRLEIDQAQLGLGNQKLILRPNETDRQIAYQIWIELSTRKIGLPMDLEHDVILEVYDSWYDFFSVTRELLKQVPVSKFRRKDTEQIIRLSVDVLNRGLRPHLTKWQARFRNWHQRVLSEEQQQVKTPQETQKEFPDYESLKRDLETVSERLVRYREKMYELLTN